MNEVSQVAEDTAQLARQGRLRVLATTAAKRVPGWDAVPALAELLPGLDRVGWFAIVAPTGTPAAVVARVNQDVNALLADKDLADRIALIGPLVDAGLGTEQVAVFLRREHAQWAASAKEIGLLPE